MTITHAAGPDLVPWEGVEVLDGQTIAAKPPVWLRVEPSNLITRRRWVRLRYSSSMFDEPVRPLIRFTTATGGLLVQAMNGPIFGSAEWIGRVPDHTTSVELNPCRRLGPFSFRLDSVATVSRLTLLRRGLTRDPQWVPWAARSWVLNSRQEAWQAMKFAAAATPIEAYASWRAQFSRPLELGGLDRPRADWNRTPFFRFLMRLTSADKNLLQTTVASLQQQIYPHWSLHGVVSEATSPTAVLAFQDLTRRASYVSVISDPRHWQVLAENLSLGDQLAIIEPGDALPNYALAVLAEELAREPRFAVIYTDEDSLAHNDGSYAPILKPDWSPVFNQSARYVGRLTCVRFERIGVLGLQRLLTDEQSTLDQVLNRAARNEVGHVRRILYHRRAQPSDGRAATPR